MDYRNLNDFELVYMVSEDEDSLNVILKKYKPIVESLAFSYVKQYYFLKLEVEDLVQEGMLGLSAAVWKFRPDKDILFYTYALLFIKRSMLHYIRKCNSGKNKILDFARSFEFLENELVSLDMDPFSVLEDQNLNSKIILFKHSLEFSDSLVFDLKLSGFSYNEISSLLEIPKVIVSRRLASVRKKLKNYLLNSFNDL